MGPIKSIDKLNELRRQNREDGSTSMNQTQPLNEIGGIATSFNDTLASETEKLNMNNDNEPISGYDVICDECQIIRIVGSCNRCGLFQYGNNYDILIKKK